MPADGLGTRFAAAGESPGLALWRVTNRWQAAMRAALAPHDLTHVQYVLLASLVWLGQHGDDGPVTQTALADAAATDPMMTSQVVRALEAKGLLTRERHPEDGRARVLRATPGGVDAARNATASVEQADADFFAGADERFTDGLLALARSSRRSTG
ncbi:MarR family winged helix-turn-helix transcriptional regulator [Amnibacterium setariae]|uniref:MarR family transcriptional regulator n=1 Tax=Amnibacterium setariae TaxID=2306585 RepID=A0A3A1TU18_9MICO|nr:MarR family winged helix-turn-helix transcriptional regulator [Amnibacterium setariae]RIX27692.1 MarR family transcriptional regulator [Amnibacterium setariae]